MYCIGVLYWYNDFTPSYTIHKFAITEVGVSIYKNQMLVYTPQYQRKLKTINENITVGFFTRKKSGVLMQLTDDLTVSN